MTTDVVRQIADAVLYEGYILWPYRKSSIKNHQRFGTFGGIYPQAYSRDRGGDDPSAMQAQCLLEAPDDACIDVGVRFLHVVDRQVARETPDGLQPVDELELGAERHVSWQEAAEREVRADGLRLDALAESRTIELRVPAGSRQETLDAPAGGRAGALIRSWRGVDATLEVGAEPVGPSLHRLTVRIANTTPWSGGTREQALEQTLCSAHTTLHTHAGAFHSLTDPPDELREHTGRCENVGTWPVLIGEDGDRSTLLCSPIILPDYPQVAPESPGDLFDATEIDQMLVLNILSLTDEERREMRDSDPRAREILERTEALSPEELMRLNGTIRDFGMVRER